MVLLNASGFPKAPPDELDAPDDLVPLEVGALVDADAEELNIRSVRDGELELHISRTKQMLAATLVASMSLVAISALFMSLWA